jgi:cobalt/nickel transport system ATP-binding protein
MNGDSRAIAVLNLSFTYPDGSPALENVTLHVAQGERVALCGGNGAGKSTLLLHLNGVLQSVCVQILGLAVAPQNLPVIRQKVGLVFQNPDDQLFCPTVYDDVAFGPRNLGLPDAEVRQRVTAALETVKLSYAAHRSAFHLSIGEKKRAAVATVLAMQPEILVLDEPTSNLDPRGRRELCQALSRVGGTQLIATHDLDLVRQLCSRVVVLRRGHLAGAGMPAELLKDEAFLRENDLI